MNQDRLTEKSLEALQAANRLAAKMSHQQLEPEHLLLALLDQEKGLATSVLNKADLPAEAIKLKVHRELEKMPRVSGGSDQVGISIRLNRVLCHAEDEAKKLK